MEKKPSIKTPEENIIKTLKGKKVLFLENDNVLENGLDEFENILKRGEITYTILFELSEKPMEEIIKAIAEHDAIIFMTQWVTETSKKLADHMFSLKKKKIVIEAYICDPTWYYKPKTKHDVYIYMCMTHFGEADKESEKFYKLSGTSYWDYKNEFDK